MFEREIRHEGLNKYKIIKGKNWYVVQQKVEMQKREWDEMWKRKQEQIRKMKEREQAAREKQQKKTLAENLTSEAKEQLEKIENILLHTLGVYNKIEWDELKDTSVFSTPKPKRPVDLEIPKEPLRNDPIYQSKISFFERIIPSMKRKKKG